MDFFVDGIVHAVDLLFSGDRETYSAVLATLQVSSLSIVLSLIIGLPLGFMLAFYNFPGRRQVRALVDTLLALPTVVVGLLVYGFISRRGLLGDLGLLYTISGIVIAQVVLILPIVISLSATAIESLDYRLKDTLLTLGASQKRIVVSTIYEARFAILTAAVTAYGRAISEVGVSMMIGGNIKWHTRTITTAIALESGKGEFAMGIALGIILLSIVFIINGMIVFFRRLSG